MHWYWKARIHNKDGQYGTVWIKTNCVLHEIDTIRDFYKELTGCKLLLEGMSETAPEISPNNVGLSTFDMLWRAK